MCRKNPQKQRDHGDPAHRDGVGQVHIKSFICIISTTARPSENNSAEKLLNSFTIKSPQI
jgi:hypothetical protein